MSIKKIKISELPLYNSLKGLFTIGTDADNNSVKVSLEFVEEETNRAVEKATTAAKEANDATKEAKTAALAATNITTTATEVIRTAEETITTAKKVTNETDQVKKDCIKFTEQARSATERSQQATTNCNNATQTAQNSIQAANSATEAAIIATNQVLAAFAGLIPSKMAVSCLEKITFGNLYTNLIEVTFEPVGTLKNVIFQSDNKSVRIDPNGRIHIIGIGKSLVHVIPTCNTAIAKTIQIEVINPTLRMASTRNALRFMQSGRLRLN